MLTIKFMLVIMMASGDLQGQNKYLSESVKCFATDLKSRAELILADTPVIVNAVIEDDTTSEATSEEIIPAPVEVTQTEVTQVEAPVEIGTDLAEISSEVLTPRAAPLPTLEDMLPDVIVAEIEMPTTATELVAVVEEPVVEEAVAAEEVAVVEETAVAEEALIATNAAPVCEVGEDSTVASIPVVETAGQTDAMVNELEEVQGAWSSLDDRTKDAILLLIRADAMMNGAE